jgi:O-antigen/teichoic acid export membrane protein
MKNTGRKMLVGGAARAAGLVVRMVVGFFMMPFLVASLGDYWYGVYYATVGLVANFHILDFGFANATMRETTIGLGRSDDEAVNRIINTAFRIYVALGGLTLLLTLVLTALVPRVIGPESAGTVRLVLLILGLDLSLAFPTKAAAGVVQAKLRYDLLLIIDLVTFGISVGGTVWALTHGYGVLTLAIITAVVGLLHSISYMTLVKYLFPPLRINWRLFDAASGRQLASYSLWSFLIQIANQMRFRIDSLTTGALYGGEAVTHYAIGARLVEYGQLPLVQVSNTALPVLTRLHATEEGEHTSRVVLFLLRLGIVVAVYAAGLVIFLGGPFITRWMGPNHEVSPQVAAVLSVGFMTEVALIPLTNWLFASARHRMLAIANLTEALVNIALSIILGKMFGLIGIAMGTVIPLLVFQIGWVAPYACKGLGISRRRFAMLIVPGALAATVFLIVALALRNVAVSNGYVGLILAGGVITLVYWPTVLFACLGKQDRGFIWRAVAVQAAQ